MCEYALNLPLRIFRGRFGIVLHFDIQETNQESLEILFR